jgi:hypothetical protein
MVKYRIKKGDQLALTPIKATGRKPANADFTTVIVD